MIPYRPLIAAAVATGTAHTSADTITVCADGCDYSSIQAAIDVAQDGDTISIGPGEYFERCTVFGYLDHASHLVIEGSAGPDKTIVNGQGFGTVFAFGWSDDNAAGVDIEIRGLTIRNGRGTSTEPYYGAAIDVRVSNYEEFSRVTLSNCSFEDCAYPQPDFQSAFLIRDVYLAEISVDNCRFSGGNAPWIDLLGRTVDVHHTARSCTFEDNSSSFVVSNGVLVDCTFQNNDTASVAHSARSIAGSRFLSNRVEQACVVDLGLSIQDSVFEGNESSSLSAGVSLDKPAEIRRCDFRDNTGADRGAISVDTSVNSESTLIVDCRFERNSSDFGGAVWASPGSLVEVYNCSGCENLPTAFYGKITDAGANDFAPVCCPADLNRDGQVASDDLGLLIALWGTDGTVVPGSDLDGDGSIRAGDLGLLIAAWGSCL